MPNGKNQPPSQLPAEIDRRLHPLLKDLLRNDFQLLSLASGSGLGACVSHNVEDILTSITCVYAQRQLVLVSYTERMLRHPPTPPARLQYDPDKIACPLPEGVKRACQILLHHGFVLVNINIDNHCLRSLRFMHDNHPTLRNEHFGATVEVDWTVC